MSAFIWSLVRFYAIGWNATFFSIIIVTLIGWGNVAVEASPAHTISAGTVCGLLLGFGCSVATLLHRAGPES